MALRFVDSFAHMGTNVGLLPFKWTASQGALAFTTDTTSAVNGFGLDMISGFLTPGGVRKTLDHQTSWIVGCRIFTGALDGAYQGLHNSTTLAKWTINNDGTLSIYAGSVTIATSTLSLHTGRQYYIEMSYTLSGTSNINVSSTLRVNGIQWVTGNANSGINQTSLLVGTTTVNGHLFTGPSTNGNVISDCYICDATGSFNNTFLGDVKIQLILTNGDSTPLNWIPSGTGTTHWNLINEVPPDDDTTYVYQTATGSVDLWQWQDIPAFSGTVLGVQYSLYARKDAEGSKEFQQVVGTSGTNTFNTISPSDDYIWYPWCYDTDPDTGIAWTQVGFNAKVFGAKLIL